MEARYEKIQAVIKGHELVLEFCGFENAKFFAKNVIEDGEANPIRLLGIKFDGMETEWFKPYDFTKIVKKLSNMGLVLSTSFHANFDDAINAVNAAANKLENGFVTWEHRCTGWYTIKGGKVYLGADSVGMSGGIVSHFDNTGISMNRQIKKAGTLEGWVDAVEKFIVGKRINEAVMAASFAGILRGLYPDEPFSKQGLTLNIFGESGNGKTTLVKAAHSIFSSPDTFQNYNGTANALIQTLAERGEMVSAVDDVCQGGKKNILDLIFNAASGVEKNRCQNGGKTRQQRAFCGTIITTNVTPILRLTGENVGQLRRVLEVGITDTDKITDSGAEADAMTAAFDANYGHAAEQFARTLLEKISLEEIRELYTSYYKAADGKVANGLQNKLALVLVCAEICNRAFFKEAEKKFDVQSMLEYLVNVCQKSAQRFVYPAASVQLGGLVERLKTYFVENKAFLHKGRFMAGDNRSAWLGAYMTSSKGDITVCIPDTGDCEGTFDAILAGYGPEDIIGKEQKPVVDGGSVNAALHNLKNEQHVLQARAKGYKKNVIMEHGGKQEPVYACYFGKDFKL